MAITADTLLGGIGAFGGGRNEVKVQAAAARIVERAGAIRKDILAATEKFGARLGPTVGSDFFDALLKGSSKTASAARADESRKLFGVEVDPRTAAVAVPALGILALLALGYFLFRGSR